MPLTGMPAGTPKRSDVVPTRPDGSDDSGQGGERHVQQSGKFFVPLQPADVEQHRAACVGDVGDVVLTPGQIPHDPRIDRAEGKPRVDRYSTVAEQPLELRAAEVGVEYEPRAPADEIEVACRGESVAALCRATVLPDDRPPMR